MFRSIEYKLLIYISLLIVCVSGSTFFFLSGEIWYGVAAVAVAVWSLGKLWKHYGKFNRNILFLLNALDNGDYSFHFSESRLSRREKELNAMLNRIKEILVRARKEVIENEKFLSLIVESVPTGIVIMDDRGIVVSVNKAATDLLGLSVFTHVNQLSVIDETYPGLFRNLTVNDRLQLKVPTEKDNVQVTARMSRIVIKEGELRVVTLNNIGNELEAKELDSWIKLIRVMTHEIMNSIAPINSLSETMLDYYRNNRVAQNGEAVANTVEAFQTIQSTARGMLNFVESYRRFTGVPRPSFKEFSPVEMVKQVLALTEPEMKRISTEIICQAEDFRVCADPDQIKQVLVNIIKNASEAGGAGGRRIIIRLESKDAGAGIEVWNNGTPIAEEVLPHIFIPFYTTKTSGSGIGLSLSRYIMRLHGGNLKHRKEGEWTVFSLIFPG